MFLLNNQNRYNCTKYALVINHMYNKKICFLGKQKQNKAVHYTIYIYIQGSALRQIPCRGLFGTKVSRRTVRP
jgi:hypothetical protein